MFFLLSLVAIIGCFSPLFLYAATFEVTAEYKPGIYESGGARFVSTTRCIPPPGFSNIVPGICDGGFGNLDYLLFHLNNLNISKNSSGAQTGAGNAIFYVKSPTEKMITISSETGNSFNVHFIPKALGIGINSPSGARWPAEPFNSLFSRATLSGGCQYLGGRANVPWSSFQFLWRAIPGVSCYNSVAHPNGESHSVNVNNSYLGFSIKAPAPLDIPNGIYRGSMVLSVGPTNSSDISFGTGSYGINQVVINLTLTVRHQIKVDFPPGSQNIVLQPPGGWSQWIYGKRNLPLSLEQKLPFKISASADYSISTVCQYSVGIDCALKNTKNEHLAKLETFYEQRGTSGVSLIKLPIRVPINSPAEHHRNIIFKVSGNDISEMMSYPGATYKGVVTLIIDASI